MNIVLRRMRSRRIGRGKRTKKRRKVKELQCIMMALSMIEVMTEKQEKNDKERGASQETVAMECRAAMSWGILPCLQLPGMLQ